MNQSFHLRGLNGIRAIAALAVVISHTLFSGFEFGLKKVDEGLVLARFGVTIFFALSGFLITYLLLLEKEKDKKINIKAFYIRRVLRIWPLYYLYLFVCIFCIYIFNLANLPGSFGFYMFLGANIPFVLGTYLPLLAHYWSLGVEEQFYLFWPWVVKASANIVKVLIIFIGLFLLLKFILWYVFVKTNLRWPYIAIEVTRFECMAIGALGAVLSFKQYDWFRKIVFHPIAQIIAWGVLLSLFLNKFHIASVIDSDIIAVISVVLIMNVSLNPKTAIRLDSKIPDFLGKISFGIYVYHPLIIFLVTRFLAEPAKQLDVIPRYIFLFGVVIGLTVFIAWSSYEFYEKIFLNKKRKYASVQSVSEEEKPVPVTSLAKV